MPQKKAFRDLFNSLYYIDILHLMPPTPTTTAFCVLYNVYIVISHLMPQKNAFCDLH